MAKKNHKMSQQEKIEQARALEEKEARSEAKKQLVMRIFVIILCVLLVFAFCFPAVTMLGI